MGSKKTKSTTTPVYGSQLQGAQNTLNNTYNANAPKIQGYADALGGVGMDLLAKFKAGNPTVDAANDWIRSTLTADSANNPYLDDMIAMTNDNVRNQLQAKMGTRGQTGGSQYYDLIGRGLAQNETGLRYTDYTNAEARKAQAAGLIPGISAAEYAALNPAMSAIAGASSLPMDAATQYAAATGGLLGPYTTTTQKQSGGLGATLGGLLGAGLSGWASGGFKI